MKVKCVNRSGVWNNCDTGEKADEGPVYGEICTVVGEISPRGYDLAEYPCPDSEGWVKRLFIEHVEKVRIERVVVSEDLRQKTKEYDTIDMLN